MAIQMRRGNFADLDPAKAKPGEILVVQQGDPDAVDGQAAYVAILAGKIKRLATYDELKDYNQSAQDAKEDAESARDDTARLYLEVERALARAQAAATSAETAIADLETAKQSALSALDDAYNQRAGEISDNLDDALSQLATALENAESDLSRYAGDVEDAKETAQIELEQQYQRYITIINNKADDIVALTTQADQVALQALQKANEVDNELATVLVNQENLNNRIDAMRLIMEGKVDDAYEENGYLYLTSDGEVVAGPLGPFAGGGGGGGGETINAKLTVSNTTGWQSRTIAEGDDAIIRMNWSSIEDGNETGPGTVKIAVDKVARGFVDVQQGDIEVNVKNYLHSGANAVRITVSDIYEQSRTISFNITVVELSISSTFDASQAYTGAISYPYTPVGSVTKTVHFIMDGKEIGTTETAVTGRQLLFTIPQQTHGAHTFDVYFDADINGQLVRSNTLHYGLICLEPLNNTVIIKSNYNKTSVPQYSMVNMDYQVYNPASLTSEVTITVNGEPFQTITVDRTTQNLNLRADTVGTLAITIASGGQTLSHSLTVTESDITIEPETEALALHLTAYGRSNNEENPNTWTYGTAGETGYVECTMTGFDNVQDGWQSDDDGNTVLRIPSGRSVTIPYQIFKTDFRSTGKTVSIEFATRDILNYDASLLTCYTNNKGIQLTAQNALLKSAQAQVSASFKEEEHVRIDFVVEKRSENRLVYVYINAIQCGVVQYPDNDDWQQTSPANIVIAPTNATMDIYNIRVYDNNLTSQQIINNWIADTQDLDLMLARYTRNNVFDARGNIDMNRLPSNVPVGIIAGPETPQYKGDKKTVDFSFEDNNRPDKSFDSTGAQADVQGTSSQYYPVKNYKIKFKGGFTLSNGTHVSVYELLAGIIPVATFTFKADVASSESANNTVLATYYNDINPCKTPPQLENPNIRQGIAGVPMVMFWNNGTDTSFVGKYNFNLDKGTSEVFGFSEGDESWEIRNNTSNRVLWKSDDFESMGVDEDGNPIPAWLNDFEGRYPEDNTDPTRLKALATWLKSTDREAATNSSLASPVTYEGVEYTTDSVEYRLAKYKAEASEYLDIDNAIFYYIFTELFLMVDSRAKNAFPTYWAATGKWTWLPYDFDTAIGINNEGTLTFGYQLEDTDQNDGADVFNGQHSVMWCNLRDAFSTEIADMYFNLRSNGGLSYAEIERRFEEHQGTWSEAVFNEDAYFKYIRPLTAENNSTYLTMLLGSKAEQRKWWLYNRFRYMDSKWNAGDARADFITVRGYAKADITVKPYADIYPTIKYGSTVVRTRGQRNVAFTLACPLDNVNDTETIIFSAGQLLEITGLPDYKVGFADFSAGKKLKSIVVGSNASGYTNPNLKKLSVGNLPLAENVDARNCPNLEEPVDLSGCPNLKTAYFNGTSVTGVKLANGAPITTLYLPSTVTDLTLRNLKKLSTFNMPSYSNVTTVRLENNSSVVNMLNIFNAIPNGSRVRMLGINFSFSSESAWTTFLTKLKTMRGLDENNNTTDMAQLSGRIYVSTISGKDYDDFVADYPNVTLTYGTRLWTVYYYDEDGETLFQTKGVQTGGTAPSYSPSKEADAQYTYSFSGWSLELGGTVTSGALTNVKSDRNVYAVWNKTAKKYTVKFYTDDTLRSTINNVTYGSTVYYNYAGGNVLSADREFTGWVPSNYNIVGPTSCYAQYSTYDVDVSEISDTWSEIRASISDGTYKTKYKIGNYKTLEDPVFGNRQIEIVGFDKETAIVWRDMAVLRNQSVPSTNIVETYDYHMFNDANFGEGNIGVETHNMYMQGRSNYDDRDDNETITVTTSLTISCVQDKTIEYYFSVANRYSQSSNFPIVIRVNGVESLWQNGSPVSLNAVAGETYTFEIEATKPHNSNQYESIHLQKLGANYTYFSVVDHSTTQHTARYTTSRRGGTCDGFSGTNLHKYLNGEYLNSLPPDFVDCLSNAELNDMTTTYVVNSVDETGVASQTSYAKKTYLAKISLPATGDLNKSDTYENPYTQANDSRFPKIISFANAKPYLMSTEKRVLGYYYATRSPAQSSPSINVYSVSTSGDTSGTVSIGDGVGKTTQTKTLNLVLMYYM